MLTFVCLKAGTEYGPEYVNILRDMVIRNTSETLQIRFCCITDDPEGLDKGIDVIPLPSDLERWWGKLYMFKRGLFEDGDRLVFMDLDTVIVGRIDEILKYDGQFATLRDFYHPSRVGPAVIAWEAGYLSSSIWEEWEADERPRNKMGDLWWINNLDQGRFAKSIDILQDLYPEKFVSYKQSCQTIPPKLASVVCFHGVPRPHQADGWVKDFWKKGGLASSEFDVVCNTEIDSIKNNIKQSTQRGIKTLSLAGENNRPVLICGGGPSLKDTLPVIQDMKRKGAVVVGLNGSAHWLQERGIQCDWQVIIDAREENSRFLVNLPAKEYFIASQCHPAVFDAVKNQKVTLFHIDIPDIGEYVPNDGNPIQAVGGGCTVGLIAMSLAYAQGFREMHLFGYDSSFRGDEGHAYYQNQPDEQIEVAVNGRTFLAAPWMVTQANQWQDLTNQLRSMGCGVTTYGDGLLPYIGWVMQSSS